MAFTRYCNNNIDYYSREYINDEFLKEYNLIPSDIVRVVDYRRNTEYDKEGVLEFNINLFICFVQHNEYHIHHYYEDFHWNSIKKFTFKLHKLVKYPFTTIGKTLVDKYFSQMAIYYDNSDYLF
jgi:hypothetical protein